MAEALRGMRTFFVIWCGQLFSTLGTTMSRFALAIWVWQQTGEATPLVLVGVFSAVPALIAKLFAGPLIDRWDRRQVLIISDLIAGVCTCAILVLHVTDQFQVWHLYALSAVVGVVGTFQSLAYAASLTMVLSKTQIARARGMISLSEYASFIGAPLLAGLLLGMVGLAGILLIDIATFLFAMGTLLVVRIPQPVTHSPEKPRPLLRDSLYGFQYIMQRRGLLGLLLIAFTFSLVEALGFPLITPMILARTGDELALGSVRALQGIGGVAGGVALTLWGGPKRRIHGVLIGVALTGLLGDALMGLGRSLPAWLLAAFFLELFIPIVIGSYQAIWHDQIPPAIQGRVFAARDLIATVGEPASMLLGGILTDNVLEPAMMPEGRLANTFGWLVGTGDGAGMALLLVMGGILTAAVGLSGYLFRSVREVEVAQPENDVSIHPSLSASDL